MVWHDEGSKNSSDYTVWYPIPPENYVALGCILNFGAKKAERPKPS